MRKPRVWVVNVVSDYEDMYIIAESPYDAERSVRISKTSHEVDIESIRGREVYDPRTSRVYQVDDLLEELDRQSKTPGTDLYRESVEESGQIGLAKALRGDS